MLIMKTINLSNLQAGIAHAFLYARNAKLILLRNEGSIERKPPMMGFSTDNLSLLKVLG